MVNDECASDSGGEFKISVDGVDRYVSGVTENTSCSEIIYALAHSMSKRGKFVLVVRHSSGKERTLAPNEKPWAIEYCESEFELKEIDDIASTAVENAENDVYGEESAVQKMVPPPAYHDFIRKRHATYRPSQVCGLEEAMASAFSNESDFFISSLNLTRTELEVLLQSQSDAIREQKQYMASLDNSLQNNDHLEFLQLMRQHDNLHAVLNSLREEDWPQKYRMELGKNKTLTRQIEDLKHELHNIRKAVELKNAECDRLLLELGR